MKKVIHIEKAWLRLQNKLKRETAETVVRYCFGHENELAKLAEVLGESEAWVKQQIKFVADDNNECVFQADAKRMLKQLGRGVQ